VRSCQHFAQESMVCAVIHIIYDSMYEIDRACYRHFSAALTGTDSTTGFPYHGDNHCGLALTLNKICFDLPFFFPPPCCCPSPAPFKVIAPTPSAAESPFHPFPLGAGGLVSSLSLALGLLNKAFLSWADMVGLLDGNEGKAP
jgi:hypothetical protein